MRPRVFLGLTEVAGYFGNLSDGVEALGLHPTFVDLSADPYRYRGSSGFRFATRVMAPAVGRPSASASRWDRAAWKVRHIVRYGARALLLAAAVARHDTFILGGTEPFLPGYRELPILRVFRKRIVWVFLGSDHRPPYMSGKWLRTMDDASIVELAGDLRARVRMVERWADCIVAPPASAQFHRRPFVSFLAIGIPTPAQEDTGQPRERPDGAVRILHSPSDPESKGTPRVRACVEALTSSGRSIDYVEISGRPHREVLAAILRTDLVIDEVYGDTPMGVLAAEAAAAGKPTIVGGYTARKSRPEDPPTAHCLPGDLQATVAALVDDKSRREELGRVAREFVDREWRPDAVAERFMRLARGTYPQEWVVDPRHQDYVQGWGIDERDLQGRLRTLIESRGVGSLALDDTPWAEASLLSFVNRERDGPPAPPLRPEPVSGVHHQVLKNVPLREVDQHAPLRSLVDEQASGPDR